MARPEKEPKTELAICFREVRRVLGFTERKQFAEHLGVTAGSIGTYETGISEPTASALFKYKEICGVSLDWLITGKGEMFADIAKAKAAGFKPQAISAGVMKKLGHLAYTTYYDLQITLSPEDVADYGRLQEKVNKKEETLMERFDKNLVEAEGKTVSVSSHRKRISEYKSVLTL